MAAWLLVIGIGVNVVAYPEDVPYPATSLRGWVPIAMRKRFFWLCPMPGKKLAVFGQRRGLAAIRKRWLARAAGIGSEVAVRVDGAVLRGIFETIDEDCRFVIRDNDGRAGKNCSR